MSAKLAVGVDVGGTDIKVGLVDGRGHLIAQGKCATLPTRKADLVLADLTRLVDQVLSQAGADRADVAGVGLA